MSYLIYTFLGLMIFVVGILLGIFLPRKGKSKLTVNDIYDHRHNEELYYSIRRLNRATNEYLKQVELNKKK